MRHTWIQDGDEVDIFAYEIGYHNGPRCAVCGYEFCHHCKPYAYDSECDGNQRKVRE